MNSSSASSLLISGDVYAPKIQTITAITKPAIGPAIATSNKMSRFIVRPLDWISSPNVGIPTTGTPGLKYGQVVLILCFFAAIRCPDY